MRKIVMIFLGFCLLWTLFGFKLGPQFANNSSVSQSQMPQWRGAARKGVISNIEWSEDGKFLKYVTDGKRWQCDLQNP